MSHRKLSDYIEKLHPTSEATKPFFNTTNANSRTLRSRGVNRILLFPGSFNPPHRGHLDLLAHAFHHAGDDLHLVAAVVLPTDDARLGDKLCAERRPLLFSQQQRVRLWRESGRLPGWAWVYDGTEAEWRGFRAALEKATADDGVEIKFVLLAGPDAVSSVRGAPSPGFLDCADCITSDISRPVDFRCPTTLRQLPAFLPWEKVQYDPLRLERQIKVRLRGKSARVVQEAVAEAVTKLSAVHICRRIRKPKSTIRFIPCDTERQPKNPPSSTLLRKVLEDPILETFQDKLDEMALGADVLLRELPFAERPVRRDEDMPPMCEEDSEPEFKIPESFW